MQCSKSSTPGPDQNCKKFKLQRPDVLQGQNCTIIQPLSFCFFIGGYWNSESSVIHLSLFLRSFTGSQHHSHRACKFASSCANTTFREIKISSLISRLNKTIRKQVVDASDEALWNGLSVDLRPMISFVLFLKTLKFQMSKFTYYNENCYQFCSGFKFSTKN